MRRFNSLWMVALWVAAAAGAQAQTKVDATPSSTLERVSIGPATFIMGHPTLEIGDWMPDEAPQHEVQLAAFSMATYEVTVGEWAEFLNRVGGEVAWHPLQAISRREGEYVPAVDSDVAVGAVSWYEARAFCRWHGGDLPTEAQWEYAAAGSLRAVQALGDNPPLFPWGDDKPNCGVANTSDAGTRCHDHPVSVAGPTDGVSTEGVHRLVANVKEWIRDGYGPYSEGVFSNPTGDDAAAYRVVRGGSFVASPERGRTTARSSANPNTRSRDLGFRCVWED